MELCESAGLGASFIARSGALDTPFVLVDIGVRGGIHPRWHPLESVMAVYGFDATAEVRPPNDRHHYFKIALGNRDGDCTFHVPDNPYEGRVSMDGAHTVPMMRLDTLWANGTLPPADFIKIDCEGYEPEILAGSGTYLNACSLLGADIESHFHVSASLPYSHFAAINAALVDRQLRVADLTIRRALHAAESWNGTCNVLFARHFLMERDAGNPPISAILKMIAVFDVYGLTGPAVALTHRYRDIVATRINPDKLHNRLTLSPRLKAIEKYLPPLRLGIWTGIKNRLAL